VAFAAERGEELVGLAAAESDPGAVHVVLLEGDAPACQALLGRLVKLAGERAVSGWVANDRPEVQRLTERMGFVPVAAAAMGGVPSCYYHRDLDPHRGTQCPP
jgi:hypothetical protein